MHHDLKAEAGVLIVGDSQGSISQLGIVRDSQGPISQLGIVGDSWGPSSRLDGPVSSKHLTVNTTSEHDTCSVNAIQS